MDRNGIEGGEQSYSTEKRTRPHVEAFRKTTLVPGKFGQAIRTEGGEPTESKALKQRETATDGFFIRGRV